LSLAFYHAEQETASLGGLAVSVFLWCKGKDNSFLSILPAEETGFFDFAYLSSRMKMVLQCRQGENLRFSKIQVKIMVKKGDQPRR